jgi:hypothetical protein
VVLIGAEKVERAPVYAVVVLQADEAYAVRMHEPAVEIADAGSVFLQFELPPVMKAA